MFAVIRTGGKQYRVAPNQVLEIEKVAGQPGDIIELGEVLLIGGNGSPQTGTPLVAGAAVAAEVLEQKRGPKIVVFKKKRRSTYRRKAGHAQALTAIRVTEILTDGKKPSKQAAARPAPKRAEAKPEAKTKAPAKAEKKTEKKAEAKPAKKTEKAEPKKAEPKKAAAKAPAKKPAAKKTAAKKTAAKTAKPKK